MTKPSRLKTSLPALVPFLVLALASCGEGLGDSTGSTCPPDSMLTYENFGQAFMQSHCTSCHGSSGPESPALSSLEQVRGSLGDVDRAAAAGPSAVNTYMPEGGSVTEAERRELGEWLACGALE
jgi:mono/diheme cytochrome c family protein